MFGFDKESFRFPDLSDGENVIYKRIVEHFENVTVEELDLENRKREMAELRMLIMQSRNDLNIHLDDREEGNLKLFLQYQDLCQMPPTILNKFGDMINYLDLNYNRFIYLDFLVQMPNLTTLIADHNPITTHLILPYLPKLTTAWFNNCKLTELFPFVSNLGSSCPNLEFLSLMGNPSKPDFFNTGDLPSYREFRLYVISIFPKLKQLDDRPVFAIERNLSNKHHPQTLLKSLTHKSSKLNGIWYRCVNAFKFKKSPLVRRNTII